MYSNFEILNKKFEERLENCLHYGFTPTNDLGAAYVEADVGPIDIAYISIGVGINQFEIYEDDEDYKGFGNGAGHTIVYYNEESEESEDSDDDDESEESADSDEDATHTGLKSRTAFVVCVDDLSTRIDWIYKQAYTGGVYYIHEDAKLGVIWRSNATLMPLDRVVQYIPGYGPVDDIKVINEPDIDEYGWELDIDGNIVEVHISDAVLYVYSCKTGDEDHPNSIGPFYLRYVYDFAIICDKGIYYVYILGEDDNKMVPEFYSLPEMNEEAGPALVPPMETTSSSGYRATKDLQAFKVSDGSFAKYPTIPGDSGKIESVVDEWLLATKSGYEINETWKWVKKL